MIEGREQGTGSFRPSGTRPPWGQRVDTLLKRMAELSASSQTGSPKKGLAEAQAAGGGSHGTVLWGGRPVLC
jgi:hypothetical protein